MDMFVKSKDLTLNGQGIKHGKLVGNSRVRRLWSFRVADFVYDRAYVIQ